MIVCHDRAQWSFFRNTVGAWQWTSCYPDGSQTKVSYHVFPSLQKCLDDAVANGLPRKVAISLAGNAEGGNRAAAAGSRTDM